MNPCLANHLLTRLTLSDLLNHATRADAPLPRETLLAHWRAAQSRQAQLDSREAGIADQAAVLPMPEQMADHVARVLALPELARYHSLVPIAVGLVEVDALVTACTVMHEARVRALRGEWQVRPADLILARICLPLEAAATAVIDVQAMPGGGLRLLSSAPGLQVIEGPSLNWQAQDTPAAHAGALQLNFALGVPPPVMHVIRYAGRLLLRKGHHRARALRSLGLTYLPCLISACVHLDEVRCLAPELSEADLTLLFEAPRPPLLRDFDRPSLVQALPWRARQREVQVRMQVSQGWVS